MKLILCMYHTNIFIYAIQIKTMKIQKYKTKSV